MAIVKRFIAYALPEDLDSDKLQLWEATTEDGSYSLSQSVNYSYAARATEFDDLDTAKWYKIRFRNSDDGTNSAYSDVFPGDGADIREPFAAVTTTFDSARYSTASDFYGITNLNSGLVSTSDVIAGLKTAKAYIDIITDDMSPIRYSRDWGTDITRRKYNAQMELVKQCEVYLAAALIYKDLSDDRVMIGISGTPIALTSLSEPSDISPSGLLTAPTDLVISGTVVATDVTLSSSGIVSTDLTLTSDIVASGATESISVGRTSITRGAGADATSVSAAEFNVKKDIDVYDHNDDKKAKINEHNDNKLINEADWNFKKDLESSKHANSEQLRIAAFNLEKDLTVARHNDNLYLEYAKFNSEKSLRYTGMLDERNIALEEYRYNRYAREAEIFDNMSVSYATKADLLLNSFRPTSINLRYGEDISRSKFLNPTDIFNFSITNLSTETVFVLNAADFTGLGDDFNTSGCIVDATFMKDNQVEGVSGVAVEPLESRTTLVDSTLLVNGVNYHLDEWVDNNGVTQAGVTEAGTSGGYRLSFDTGVNAVSMEWLYNAAAGGFDLTATDAVTFNFYTID